MLPPGRLSFCMIVKNEEQHLRRCLDSVCGLAGEILVVDTGSTDSTLQIAAEYGAAVLSFDFTRVDFAAARNCALARACGSWILMLDADEALDPAGAPAIAELASGDRNAGYFLERRNHSEASEKPFTDYVVRLFPNRPEYRYRGRVHETIDAAILGGGGKLIRTAIGIDHRFSADSEARRRKNRRYIEILLEEIAEDPSDDSRLDFLAAEYHQLGNYAQAAEIAGKIARLRPWDARARLFCGVYHLLYQPDLKRARVELEAALKLRPGYTEAESFLRLLDERERNSRWPP